jgi:hypothetical protein
MEPPANAYRFLEDFCCHFHQIRSKLAWCKKNIGCQTESCKPVEIENSTSRKLTSLGVQVEPPWHVDPAAVGQVPAISPPISMCMFAWNAWAFSVAFWKPIKFPS